MKHELHCLFIVQISPALELTARPSVLAISHTFDLSRGTETGAEPSAKHTSAAKSTFHKHSDDISSSAFLQQYLPRLLDHPLRSNPPVTVSIGRRSILASRSGDEFGETCAETTAICHNLESQILTLSLNATTSYVETPFAKLLIKSAIEGRHSLSSIRISDGYMFGHEISS